MHPGRERFGLNTEVLQHHGVDKMFWLEQGPLSATTTNIVYLCRPKIHFVRIIAGEFAHTLPSAQVVTVRARPD